MRVIDYRCPVHGRLITLRERDPQPVTDTCPHDGCGEPIQRADRDVPFTSIQFECWSVYGPESRQAVEQTTDIAAALDWLVDAPMTHEVVVRAWNSDVSIGEDFTLRIGRHA